MRSLFFVVLKLVASQLCNVVSRRMQHSDLRLQPEQQSVVGTKRWRQKGILPTQLTRKTTKVAALLN